MSCTFSAHIVLWIKKSGRILETVGQFKASIRSFTVADNPRNGTWEIAMKLSVPSNLELDKVLSQLRILKHVLKVVRQ